MTLEQLDAILNDLDADRQALRERAREVMAARNRKVAEAEAEAKARSGRRARQSAQAGVADVGTEAE
jgi:hypothetical protein